MKRLFTLTLAALTLGACAGSPTAHVGPASPLGTAAAPEAEAGEFLPGWAFRDDATLTAGPRATVSLTDEFAGAVRLRYERGTEETLEWPGSGDGEAALINAHGQQVWSVREGAPAQQVLVPAGTYRLEVRNLDTHVAALTRRYDTEAASLRLERLGVAAEPEVPRGPTVGRWALADPSVSLIGEHIWDLNVEKHKYHRLHLHSAHLYKVNLNSTQVADGEAIFERARLTDVSMWRALMPGANFKSASLTRVDMTGASMPDANFDRLDGDRAQLVESEMPRATFRQASLWYADMSRANLTGAHMELAGMRYAKLSDIRLSGASLVGADLSGTQLAGADLSGADLENANLGSADLRGANLTGANLKGANFRVAKVNGVRIGGVVVQETYWHGGEAPAQFR